MSNATAIKKPVPADPAPRSLDWIADELAALDDAGLRRSLARRETAQGAVTEVDGRTLVNFSSNDYLGLAADPRVVQAAQQAAGGGGWGAGASPLITGRSSLHAELETRLAAFEQTEAALLFPSGFAANAGTIPALVDEGDAIFGDARNHASIIDGCRLSRARRFIYPHNDADALEQLLKSSGTFRRRLIVTDSLFSMDGDVAPIDRLAELADRYDAMLLVDEAHATGVFGPGGRGLVSHFAECDPLVESRVAVRVGTLSKALGSSGGFVAGSQQLIDWLANKARSYVFSTASPAAVAAAGIAALDAIAADPTRGASLLQTAATLRERLAEQGWDTVASTSQIVPLLVGDPNATMALAAKLREAGLHVPGIRPPSVPAGESLLRISLCAGHRQQHLDRLLEVLGDAGSYRL